MHANPQLWRPVFLGDGPGEAEKVQRWGQVCFDRYVTELEQHGGGRTGIAIVPGYDLYRDAAAPALPLWRTTVRDFAVCSAAEIRPEWRAAGIRHAHSYRSVIAEPTRYMQFLHSRFEALGGRYHRIAAVQSRAELAGLAARFGADAVVNCTGLGARETAGDASVYPVRGQTVKVTLPAGAAQDHFLICPDDDFLTYVFPRSADVLLGGTHTDHDARTAVSGEDTRSIVDRCAQLVAWDIRSAAVQFVSCGLRPARPSVRCERDADVAHLVHNYGHGGGGMTLHWGCASDVVDMLRQDKNKPKEAPSGQASARARL
jgi:glycine/D-amino acid oxidase-like deaminating enzyme